MISFEDFKKIELKIGKIVYAEKIEGTKKLMKLEVDLKTEKRQLVAGIAEFFEPNYLIGKEIPIIVNLEPKIFNGIESHGMILVADVDGKPILLHPEKEVPPGSIIK